MQRTVTVFALTPGFPGGPAKPTTQLVVDSNTTDSLLKKTREVLESQGYRVRSLSFGAKGLIAYVEETT